MSQAVVVGATVLPYHGAWLIEVMGSVVWYSRLILNARTTISTINTKVSSMQMMMNVTLRLSSSVNKRTSTVHTYINGAKQFM